MCIRTCVRVCALALCSKTFLVIVSTMGRWKSRSRTYVPSYTSHSTFHVRRVLSLHTSILLKSSFVIFFSSLTMARSRSRSPGPPPARQIVATQQTVATFYADGTSKVVFGQKRKVCKKWMEFSGDPRRKKCYARGTKWADGMCERHAKLNGCQPPQKKPKTLRNGPAESDACKIRDDDKVGLEGVVVKDDE